MPADLAAHMEAVARHLLGEPNQLLSSATELRYGTHGSLAVDLKKGMWFSHEESKGGGVLDLIRRERGLANGAAVAWMRELGIHLAEAPQQRGRPKRRIVETYDYPDENGELLFQVVRFEPKNFGQRRPDGRGGWVWSLGGARLVLYNLPGLLAADPIEPVFVTEGEKDADRLRALGFVATTCPGGANKWHKVDDAVLAGRRVVLVPDLDEAGHAHERQVAGALAGKAASVRVLRLPIADPGEGRKDVSDWLDRCGGTAEELRRLAAEAPEATAETEDARPKLVLVGGQRAEVLREIEAALRDPAKVKPGWLFARGLAPAALRLSADATKLRAGKVERLARPFRGFPFATETDRAAVVGEVLTLLTRHLVPRAPAFLHNATEAGSGKTKLFDTVSIVALGGNAALLNADILADETELKKVLTTLTLAAAPLAVFDNVARGAEITSPGLSNYLTATVYGDRLLGGNEELKAATCTVIGMTGNGCEIAGDNTRRILRVDLDAGVERPELREFDFDCEAEAREERGELSAAALTILRAHALAGWSPVAGRGALGSFEDWDRLVCGALAFAGAPDILALLEKTRTVDPERGRLVEVLRVLQGVGAIGIGMKAGEIIREAERVRQEREGDEEAKLEAEGWLEVLCRFGKDGQPNAAALGRYLSRNKGRVVDGLTLLVELDTHTKTTAFRVETPAHARDCGGMRW